MTTTVLSNARVLHVAPRQVDIVSEQTVPTHATLPVHHSTASENRVGKAAGVLRVTVLIEINPRVSSVGRRSNKHHTGSNKDGHHELEDKRLHAISSPSCIRTLRTHL
ncbi:MAG: hypothetical protein ACFNUS_01660 [Candidatus Saccharimonas sp.]